MSWTPKHTARATAAALLATAVFAVAIYRHTWLPWLGIGHSTESTAEQPVLPADQVVLTPKAQESLHPDAQRLYPRGADDPYWRTVQLPGEIVDRPGFSDRSVVASVAGTVLSIHAFPGDIVSPGQLLVTLRLVSESLYTTQSELFKTTREIEITQDRKNRLSSAEVVGAVAGSRVLDLDNQLRRLDASVSAYRQELRTRGLTAGQIDGAAQGRFVGKVEIVAPQDERSVSPQEKPARAAQGTERGSPTFEVQQLRVELGQRIEVGQTLCLLSDHRSLQIQGYGLHQDIPLVARALKQGYPVDVEFLAESANDWPEVKQSFQIRSMANTLDSSTRAFSFYLPLENQSRNFEKDGRKAVEWRFLPGQRVRLNVRVEKLEDVYVCPAEAVVREGAEAFVFEKKGDSFLRRPVRVLYADRRDVVIDRESLPLGCRVVRHGAPQINRMLKAQGGQVPPGFHIHPDGSIHMNADEK